MGAGARLEVDLSGSSPQARTCINAGCFDTVTAVGVLKSGAEVAYQVASVPHAASGVRLEIYGRKGTLVLTSKTVNIGPNQLHLATGGSGVRPSRQRRIPS